MVKLGDIAKVVAGQAAPKEFSDQGISFIRAGHLEELISGISLEDLPKVSEDTAKKNRLKLLPKGSILFAKSGMSAKKNRIYINSEESYFVSHLAAILPSSNYNTAYLSRYLNWFNPTNLILDEAYPSIRLEDINNLQIPLPDLPSQQKIAALLDKADELRQYNKQLIQKYDALTQSLFLDMFGDPVRNEKGWEKHKLGDYFNDVKCGPFGSALKKDEFVNEGIPVWNMDNIVDFNFEKKARLHITEEKFNQLLSYSVKNGDIIISRAGTVGKMCVVKTESRSIISTNLIKLSLDSKRILPIYFVLSMKYFASRIGKLKTGSESAFTHMNTGVLKNLVLNVPPIFVQEKFEQQLALIEQQKEQAQQALQKSEDLFNSLLQRAFKGELVPEYEF